MMKWLALRMARAMIAFHMRGHGYTKEQRTRLLKGIDWNNVWEIVKKWGPILLQVFVKYILPLLLMLEAPQGQPIKDYWLHEDEDMELAGEFPGVDINKEPTDLE